MLAAASAGCSSTAAGPDGLYAEPQSAAPVTANPTPYSAALVCEAGWARARHVAAPRLAIGRIADDTGRAGSDTGPRITQGASLMAMSAFAKAGMPLVERYDTAIAELELRYARDRLISDRPRPGATAPAPSRRIVPGQLAGSDFFVVGGITELNPRIADGRAPIMNVGLDLRLVNTQTLQVVDVISYQQQIVVSGAAQEPVQAAVRSLIERAAVEMAANLYGMPGPEVCERYGSPSEPVTTGPTGAYVPAYNTLRTNNGATRADPDRWNDQRDPDLADPNDRY